MGNKEKTELLRVRVNSARLEKARKIWEKIGMKPSDAVSIFIAQTVNRGNLPFAVGEDAEPYGGALQPTDEQLKTWDDALGEY